MKRLRIKEEVITKKEYTKMRLIEFFDNTNDEEAIKEIDRALEYEICSENDLNMLLALIKGDGMKSTSREYDDKRQEVSVTLGLMYCVIKWIKDIPF